MPAPEYSAFKEEFDRLQRCSHPKKELRMRHDRSGRAQLALQCLICGGRTGEFLARSALNGRSLADVPPWDAALEDYSKHGVDEKRKKAWDEIKGAAIAKRKKEYDAYLLSETWATKRQKVIERAGGICEGCRHRKASQAHHLTYEHLFDEFLFELVALCKPCHTRIHPEAALWLDRHFDVEYTRNA